MLCPYKTKTVHATEMEDYSNIDVYRQEFCKCDYDACYFFTTHIAFDEHQKALHIHECKRAQHDWEVNT